MKKTLLAVTAALLLGFVACGDRDDYKIPPGGEGPDYGGTKGYLWDEAPDADVYITDLGRRIFKNGITQPICTEGIPWGYSVVVSDGDVYVGGEERDQLVPPNIAAIWKNGERQIVGNSEGKGFSRVHGIIVSGGNVYAAGTQCDADGVPQATLWINGQPQTLSHSGSGEALTVSVDGDDVYVGGDERGNAIIWKNGEVFQVLHNGVDGGRFASVYSIVVHEGDIYALVNDFIGVLRTTLWKNGVPQILSNRNSISSSLFVSEGDTYVVGAELWPVEKMYEIGTPFLWKNGEKQALDHERPFTLPKGVSVLGGNVYIVGYESWRDEDGLSRTRPILWINGEIKDLSQYGLMGLPYSIFVTEKDTKENTQ
jgi:hypothetical protein